MRKLWMAVLTGVLMLSLASTAAAWSSTYDPSQNIYVNLTTDERLARTLWGLGLANTSFDTQEQAHEYAASRGLGVKHSYVVLKVNGRAVLFVDPPCFYPTGEY